MRAHAAKRNGKVKSWSVGIPRQLGDLRLNGSGKPSIHPSHATARVARAAPRAFQSPPKSWRGAPRRLGAARCALRAKIWAIFVP